MADGQGRTTLNIDRTTTISIGVVVLIVGGLIGVAVAAGHSVQRIHDLERFRKNQVELNERVVTAIERLTERSDRQQEINQQMSQRDLRMEQSIQRISVVCARLETQLERRQHERMNDASSQ